MLHTYEAIAVSTSVRLATMLASAELAASLLFAPAARTDSMADLWLYRRPSDGLFLLNYLVQSNSSDQHCPPPTLCSWNGVSSGVSSDGVHFKDLGVVLRKDCAGGQRHASESGPQAPNCATWMGSGSVWPLLGSTADADDEWVMNFSQEYDCQDACPGGANSSSCNCQSMFFATSKDLLSWIPVSPNAEQHPSPLVFKYDTTKYFTPASNPESSRWDCMSAIPRPGGGYYAYWTASPISAPGSCHGPQTLPKNWTRSCGAGFGESGDGLHWRALPSPGPTYASAELGGVAVVNGSVWMLFDEGHLFRAASPAGPFLPVEENFDFLDQSVGVGFPRIWGSVYTGSSTLTLLTHNQMLRTTTYAALIKRVELGSDGVLRAVWWNGNDILRGDPLAILPTPAPDGAGANLTFNRTSCMGPCLTQGLWLEGTLAPGQTSGVWLQTNSAHTGLAGVAFVFDAHTDFGIFKMGIVDSPSAAENDTNILPTVVNRSMQIPSDHNLTFRLVVRNSWTEASMVEYYVNDVLGQAFSIGSRGAPVAAASRLSGVFSTVGGARVEAVHRLTLPLQ